MFRINKNCKLNNKGMSLVELLVAVAILGVIAGPLIHSFVTTATLNTKARKTEEATTAATNEMERIRSESLAKLLGFDYDTDASLTADNRDSTKDSYIPRKEYEKQKVEGAKADTTCYIAATDAMGNDVGYFKLDNTFSVNGSTYTTEAHVSPKSVKADPADTADEVVINEYTDYNAAKFANIYSMSMGQDGYFFCDETKDNTALSLFKGNPTDIFSDMTRNIVIDVTKDSSTEDTVAHATINYTYNSVTKNVSSLDFYSNATKDPSKRVALRNLYIFFSPLNKSAAHETIEIRNNSNLNLNVYLIRACKPELCLGGYKVNVKVYEAGGSAADCHTKIMTNLLQENTLKDQIVCSYASTKTGENPNYSTITPSRGQAMKAADILSVTDLANKKASDVAYDVTVYVTNEKGEQVIEYTGTKEND